MEATHGVQEKGPDQAVVCDSCGQTYGIGEWPLCPHGRVVPRKGFEPHFDYGLGRWVEGWGDVKQAMRESHLDWRDHPSAGDMDARRDRIEARKRNRAA